MTLTVDKTVKEEIEVGEFPLYRFDVCHYYKILSLIDVVMVTFHEYSYTSIQVLENEPIIKSALIDGEVITENQFLDAYTKAFYKIQKDVYPEQELTTAENDHQLMPGLELQKAS